MLAKLARCAATVAIAAGLVFTVPVAAQAFVVPPVPLPLVYGGITTTTEAAVAAGTLISPVGWTVLGVAAVAAGLYATQDYWLPYVDQLFGASGTVEYGPAVVGQRAFIKLDVSGNTVTTTISPLGTLSTGGWVAGADVYVQCRVPGQPVGAAVKVSVSGIIGKTSLPNAVVTLVQTCGGASFPAFVYTASTTTVNQPTWGSPDIQPSDKTYTASVDCISATGLITTIQATTSGTTDPVTGAGSLKVPSCEALGLGHGKNLKIDGSVGPTASKTLWQAQPIGDARYPECSPSATTSCLLQVWIDGVECTVGATPCIDWTRTRNTSPARVQCKYGTYWVATGMCNILERVYEPDGTRLTARNTDGNPQTQDNFDVDGQPVPTTTGTAAGTPPAGAPGGAPAPIPTTTGMPDPIPGTAVNENDSCWPSGTAAWNPAEWVLRPVKCALTWAFVPSSTFMASWGSGMSAAWNGAPLGQWMGAISGFGNMNIASGGCEGPALPTGFLGTASGGGVDNLHVGRGAVLPAVLHPFDACSPPMSTVAATSNLILSAGIAFYGGMRVIRQLGYAFGFQVHIGSERSTFT